MTLQYSHESGCMLVYCSPLGKVHQLPILANEQSPLTWNTTLMAYFFFFINYLLGKHFYSILKIKSNKYWIAVQNSCSVRRIQILNIFTSKEVIFTQIGDHFNHFFYCIIVIEEIKDLCKSESLRMLSNKVVSTSQELQAQTIFSKLMLFSTYS